MDKQGIINKKLILIAVKAGNYKAFGQIYNQYYQKVFNYALRFARDKDAAEELSQDVFVKLWENRDKINEDKNFDAFLFTLIRNNFIGALRKKAQEKTYINQRVNVEEGLNTVAQHIDYVDTKKMASEALAKLSPQAKSVYILSREKFYSHEEISECLGLSKNTVNNHITKSIKQLRQHFKIFSPETLLAALFIFSF